MARNYDMRCTSKRPLAVHTYSTASMIHNLVHGRHATCISVFVITYKALLKADGITAQSPGRGPELPCPCSTSRSPRCGSVPSLTSRANYPSF